MRVRLDSIGCRLNIGEIDSMARVIAADGHSIVAQGDRADLYILNTCTVTAVASRKSRHLIRQLRRSNPGAAIVVTGCLAELEPETVGSLGVDLVVGNEDKDRLVELLADRGLLRSAEPPAGNGPSTIGRRTRVFLKVQDGCDNRCTFCVVTIARGAGRSLPEADIIAEINRLVADGVLEVVLSGVHLGSYGHDLGDPRGLEHLVDAILRDTDLPRLRLSSLEPWDLDSDFFRVFSNPRLLPHLHLPLQSGCDATLRRMARRTTADGFRRLVAAARRSIPDLAISTDIMVGFPGETDDEFEASLACVEGLAFSRLHVFRYSRRDGTPAAEMPGQVPGDVAAERSRRMHELGARMMTDFHRRHIGRRLSVLWEDFETLGAARRWSGLTPNYIRVLSETDDTVDLANRITEVAIDSVVPGAVVGTIPGVSRSGIEGEPRRHGLRLPTVDGP